MLYLSSIKRSILISLALLGLSVSSANAVMLNFDEFGSQGAAQDGFNWQFTGLEQAVGDLTIKFDWTRMDFDSSSEYMDIYADGGLLGRIGNAPPNSCVAANGGGFSSDCTGSSSIIAPGSLIDNALLSITATQFGVDSSGGPAGSPYGFIAATLTYEAVSAVPVPAAIWLFGTALIGLVGFGKRKSRIAT
jgi:hypothetical protein